MKKMTWLLLLSFVAAAGLGGVKAIDEKSAFTNNPENKAFSVNNDITQIKEAVTNNDFNIFKVEENSFEDFLELIADKDIDFYVSYGDGSKSLNEMQQNSDAIIIGTVISEKEVSPLAVEATVAVSKVIKGKQFDEIEIHQMKNEDTLQLNEEYILFLGAQGDGKENSFYIKGGLQGAFLNENGSLSIKDSIMSQEIQKINLMKRSGDDFSSLLNYLSEGN